MADEPTDVWAVRVDGLVIENGPDAWHIVAELIPPDRLPLVRPDVLSGRRRSGRLRCSGNAGQA